MEPCESCGRLTGRPMKLIYFNDGGPTFLVDESCADGSAERGASVYEIDDPAAPLRLTEWMS